LHRSFPGPSWHREAVMSRVDEMDQEMMGQRESLPEELLPAIRCVQCGKCSSGCPVAFDTCHTPRRLLRFLQWGWLEEAGRSPFASLCAQCQTCTNVCPVVAASTDPANGADVTPQKVMNLLRLGLHRFALGSRMVWDCATCYQCQEHCPEGIKVTEVMLELREMAYRGFARERRLG